jgi:hypothetical protein
MPSNHVLIVKLTLIEPRRQETTNDFSLVLIVLYGKEASMLRVGCLKRLCFLREWPWFGRWAAKAQETRDCRRRGHPRGLIGAKAALFSDPELVS